MKTINTILIALTITMVSCRSVEEMIDQGDFDTALLKSVRKLSGKNDLKDKYVLAIEEAFQKAVDRDMAFIKNRYQSDRANDWYQVIERLRKIEKRQSVLEPLLPLVSDRGRKASFSFVKTGELMANAIDHFQTYTLQEGEILLKSARLGDRTDARRAYSVFERLWEFSTEYKNGHSLQDEAEKLGISHVLVNIENATLTHIPPYIMDDLLALGFRDDKWIRYYFQNEIQQPDREITVVLNSLELSPERIHEQVSIDEKEIQDGFKYQLDQNGNVQKDSLGNDIKIPVYKRIKARVIETQQLKTGIVSGYIRNYNLLTGRREQVPFDSQIQFEHFYTSFRGDRRALSERSKKFLGMRPLPFPSDEDMLVDLLEQLKPMLNNKVQHLELLV